jgi:epoxyqueuosine reductase
MMQESSYRSLTGRIREESKRLGFFQIGVAEARPLPRGSDFQAWLDRGMHGELAYMQKQAAQRKDPGRVLENARSIVVAGMNYYPGNGLTPDPYQGRIGRYAWGNDYHDVIKPRLEALLEFIQRCQPGTNGICCVDTGPVMEKVWGAETALGWTGKNSLLTARSLGSWFSIGVILLDIELEQDRPERNYCGSCTRCIKSCPTGAILEPYIVDARLCISYLTIEYRGSIPLSLRPLIGNRIYGCDDCLEACPWNRFAVKADPEVFSPREENRSPDLVALANLTPEEFKARFRGSTVLRARRDGFVRNVCVALGNSGDLRAMPALQRAMADESPLVREHAAWALEKIKGRIAGSGGAPPNGA